MLRCIGRTLNSHWFTQMQWLWVAYSMSPSPQIHGLNIFTRHETMHLQI